MNKYGKKGAISFWHAEDIDSSIELLYNERTREYTEIKAFDDPDVGVVTKVTREYELTVAQQRAFNAVFTEED
jgi:hypothetical protein